MSHSIEGRRRACFLPRGDEHAGVVAQVGVAEEARLRARNIEGDDAHEGRFALLAARQAEGEEHGEGGNAAVAQPRLVPHRMREGNGAGGRAMERGPLRRERLERLGGDERQRPILEGGLDAGRRVGHGD